MKILYIYIYIYIYIYTHIHTYTQLKMVKKLQRVPLDVSIHWRYLHQDAEKTYSEISKMKSYWKYSKATICRHMKRNIGDFVVDLRNNNQGRPLNYLFNKREISYDKSSFCKRR